MVCEDEMFGAIKFILTNTLCFLSGRTDIKTEMSGIIGCMTYDERHGMWIQLPTGVGIGSWCGASAPRHS